MARAREDDVRRVDGVNTVTSTWITAQNGPEVANLLGRVDSRAELASFVLREEASYLGHSMGIPDGLKIDDLGHLDLHRKLPQVIVILDVLDP